ncbi:porin [Massilia antarctica]|uniref:Porin n=1 Tax=Massilia antarctica TaxID=2765360 RepID=A0AA48WBU1_9BURK|nr:porin [Massilia antarctica]QPI49583.1 porin [Massilia antarctica]
MKPSSFALLALCACVAGAHAQTQTSVYRAVLAPADAKHGLALVDVSDLFDSDTPETATKVFGYPGKRMGLQDMTEPRRFALSNFERDRQTNRAWGLSVGISGGPVTLRLAHQNKSVAKVAPATSLGNRMDAKNSIVAANVDLGNMKAYAAYSANRGWGASPLWNPDNPYGAAMASTPSTDSRDVLVGIAVPVRAMTYLVSFVRRNDRDLANRDVDMLAFGATYQLSRRTDFYTAFSLVKQRTGPGYTAMSAPDGGKGWSALNIGMRHSF